MTERSSSGATGSVEPALEEWRAKAVKRMLLLFGFSVLPPILAWFFGYVLPPGPELLTFTVILLLVICGVAMHGWPTIVRVWLLLLVAYCASIQGLIWYSGAMARVWLMSAPILALILAGPRSALVATVISVGLTVLHVIATLTGLTARWQVSGFDESQPAVIVARAAMWLAFFLPVLILAQQVHGFLLRSLAAERGTSARLQEEVARRQAAHESLARLSAEREELEREIARVGDEERRRLGQELHDGVSQQLAATLLRCSALEQRLAADCSAGAEEANELIEMLECAIDEVYEVARSLSPVAMDPEALKPALSALARQTRVRYKVPCEYREAGDFRLPDREKTLDLYRIAQEAVNNAGKHARARQIAMTLTGEDGHVLLTVEDDGRGVASTAATNGLGLRIMAFRAERIGGTLRIEPRTEGGTRVVCRVPTSDLETRSTMLTNGAAASSP